MIMVYCVARLPEQNTAFIQWILKKKISHLNFVLQLFGNGTVDNYHQCHGIASIFTSGLIWQTSGSETLNIK